MGEVVYICLKCGEIKLFPSEHKFKGKDMCPKCNSTFVPANNRQNPPITFKQYQEMVENNTWEDYLILTLPILPYVKQLKEKREPIKCEPPINNSTNVQDQSQPTPKCPTCGSTNIRRISATEKVVNVGMFGLFGNKRKYQFECLNPNCKYKW